MARNGLVPGARLPAPKAFGGCNRIDLPSFKVALVRGQRVRTAFKLVRGGLGGRARSSSGPAHVAAGASIDPDQFTLFNKQRDLNHFTGL
jgi:hypothetical protein